MAVIRHPSNQKIAKTSAIIPAGHAREEGTKRQFGGKKKEGTIGNWGLIRREMRGVQTLLDSDPAADKHLQISQREKNASNRMLDPLSLGLAVGSYLRSFIIILSPSLPRQHMLGFLLWVGAFSSVKTVYCSQINVR